MELDFGIELEKKIQKAENEVKKLIEKSEKNQRLRYTLEFTFDEAEARGYLAGLQTAERIWENMVFIVFARRKHYDS